MSAALPPKDAAPVVVTLPTGTTLWRIHADRWMSTRFNPTLRDGVATFDPLCDQGGRFDATKDDPYAYLYAAADTIGAVAEALLRDRTPPPPLILRRAKLDELVIAHIETCAPIDLVLLHGPGLTAIGQDAWLTASGPSEYGLTREWARALRAWSPGAGGFAWRSRLDNDRKVYVLFEDRCPAASLRVVRRLEANEGTGLSLVRRALAHHGVVLS
jgi:hypothetical protein